MAQQDLIRARNAHTTALGQAHAQAADLDDRLKASKAAEREASARSNQQATSLVESAARLQQQLASSRANDERTASTSLDRGANPLFDVPDQFFVIVSCAGGQRIIIVLEPYDSPVSR